MGEPIIAVTRDKRRVDLSLIMGHLTSEEIHSQHPGFWDREWVVVGGVEVKLHKCHYLPIERCGGETLLLQLLSEYCDGIQKEEVSKDDMRFIRLLIRIKKGSKELKCMVARQLRNL